MPKVKTSDILLIAGAFLGLIGAVFFVGNVVLWIFCGVSLRLVLVWVVMLIVSGAMVTPPEK